METNNYYLAKFGKQEDLKSLAAGQLFFSSVSKYRNDGTAYRGDRNEGKIPIDPSTVSIFDKNGNDLFSALGVPRPDTVMQGIVDDDNQFMFCAAIIDLTIMQKDHSNSYILSEKFKEAIKSFGDYVLFFNSLELINNLHVAQEMTSPKFGYMYGPIWYRDLGDFSDLDEYRKAYYANKSAYDRYFVKSIDYRVQNEWRIVIDGSNNFLKANHGDGYLIEIEKLKHANLFETKVFLNTLQCSE